MSEEQDGIDNAAPIEDESSTTQDLRAALNRARVDDLPENSVQGEDLPSAAATAPSVQDAPSNEAPVFTAPPEVDSFEAALDPEAAAATVLAAGAAAGAANAGAEPLSTIQVPTDHPMAGFYLDAPSAPEFKSNRGMGILISLLATVAYAVLFAGIISALLAPLYTASEFLPALFDYLLSLAFLIPVGVFFVTLVLLVVIVNRSGWWAYVFGGFFVGVAVWLAAIGGMVLSPDLSGMSRLEAFNSLLVIALLPLPILAGVAARELTVWFGAWIGARGRKVTARNAQALEEYENALAESQEKQTASAVHSTL